MRRRFLSEDSLKAHKLYYSLVSTGFKPQLTHDLTESIFLVSSIFFSNLVLKIGRTLTSISWSDQQHDGRAQKIEERVDASSKKIVSRLLSRICKALQIECI